MTRKVYKHVNKSFVQKDASKQPSALFQLGFLHPDREKALTIKKKAPLVAKI